MIKDMGQGEMYIVQDGKSIYIGECLNAEIDIQVDEVAKKRTEKLLKVFNNRATGMTISGRLV